MPCRPPYPLLFALALTLAGARAHADKKKPGLFDFEQWKTPAGHERDAARHLLPGRFDLTPAPGRPVESQVFRLRIYADDDYRTLLSWQKRLRAQIERINAVAEPVFGVRFEIESIRDWNRSHRAMPLDPILAELEALDPAREVSCVIGLVTPMRGITTSVHQVGDAALLSRHFVLRAMDDEQELLALDREFTLLDPAERQSVYSQRKAHKEVVIFLHEWGHTLGLLHHEDPAVIMNPSYDPHQASFSAFEQSQINLVLARRFERPAEAHPEVAALESFLTDAPADEGSDKDRAQLLNLTRQRARGVAGTPVAGAGDPNGVTHVQIDRYNRAVASANAGRTEEAWADLAPVIAELMKATLPKDPALWRQAAAFAVNLGALSAAEGLMARLGQAATPEMTKLAAEIESARHRVALPPNGEKSGVPAEREVAYVAGYCEMARLLSSANAAGARQRFQRFVADFPDAPATDVVACELDMRAKNSKTRAAAAKRCEAAVAKYGEAVRALVLLGAISATAGRDTVAEKYLQRAIQVEPGEPGPWRMLGQLYRSTHATSSLSQLESRHQALFSTPLPR
jgi:tetratricopeptide (TPR) repeat protein